MAPAVLLLSTRALRVELALVQKALLDGPGHCREAVLHANVALGRRFQVGYAVVLRQLLPFFPAYFSFINEVALISNQHLTDIIVSKFFNFKHPLPDVFERFPVGHVIHHDDPVRPSIVTCRQRSKSFLSCGIPYLEFNVLSIHFYCFDFEVDANGVEEVVIERVFLIEKRVALDLENRAMRRAVYLQHI